MNDLVARSSPIHGTGLFTCRHFVAGEYLTQYQGPIVDQPPGPDASGLIHAMELSPGRWIDGSGDSNIARFANHSCNPNAEAVATGGGVELRAKRDLAANEEVTFDYGYGLADALAHPCKCGAPGCPGRIVAEPLRSAIRRHLRPSQSRD